MARWAMLTCAMLLLVLAGGGNAEAQLNARLTGSDALNKLVPDVIAGCPGATNLIYVGVQEGNSNGFVFIDDGLGAMQGLTSDGHVQHIAPMARPLSPTTGACSSGSRQLLIGLDSVSVVAKNESHLPPASCPDDLGTGPLVLTGIPSQFLLCSSDSQCHDFGTTCDTTRQFCVPGGSLPACSTTQGCSPDGAYTFDNGTPTDPSDDWKDVLAQIYGGQNHTSLPPLVHDPNEVNADGAPICFTGSDARNCVRNPAKIDCANPVRGVLLASYGQLISNAVCTSSSPQACVKVKHAFRRDDLSPATDAFAAIVGLIQSTGFETGLAQIAPYTTLRSTAAPNNPEIADFAAIASPFCNAGTAAMNKGFSDNLDLDPYRRACSAGPAPDRFALDSVCQEFAGPNNSDLTCYIAQGSPAVSSPANYPQRDRSAPQGRGVMAGGTVDTLAAVQVDYTGNLTRPRCLGVVLPISIPDNLGTAAYPAGGNCTPGVRVFVNPWPAHQMLCPDGTLKANSGACRLPQNTANGRLDCIVDSTGSPGNTPDPRVYNLLPIDSQGHITNLFDAYQNPNFPGTQLHRLARRYYGIQMVRPDDSQAPPTITTGCTFIDSSSQIGCLVKASPCSIGYSGREAADATAPFNNVALRIQGVQSTQTTIENHATGGVPVYPLARRLWLSSFQDPSVGFAQPSLTAAELSLANCMGLSGDTSLIDGNMTNHGFIPIPASVTNRIPLNAAGGGCPLP